MKKIIVLAMTLSLCLTLVGCGSQLSKPIDMDDAARDSGSLNQPLDSKAGAKEITIEEAKAIALKHAKVAESDVSFIKAEPDHDDNVLKYDIEFYANNKEYDYEINRQTGEIISYDFDADGATKHKITAEQAKDIALKHANLVGQQVTFHKTEADHDDGRATYDIEFYHNGVEYSYEIDGDNGQVISFEKD